MKIRYLVLLLLFPLIYTGCGKIDLIDDKSPSGPDSNESEGGHPLPEQSDSCYTVAELSAIEDNTMVLVGGYIVGFVQGNSITKTQFTADNAVETNIVIADDSLETDYALCAPMQLVKGSDARSDLNLSDHPENLGRFVVLLGVKNRYYYTAGLKPVKDYVFADSDEDSPHEPHQPVEPELKPRVYPVLSNKSPRIIEGR